MIPVRPDAEDDGVASSPHTSERVSRYRRTRIGSRTARVGLQLVPAVLLVLIGSLLFPSAGHDDTHITCWPAYTLSRFGQILNYNGDRVEQSSSLLQVVALAALDKITGVDLVTLAKLSSIATGMGTVLVLFALVERVSGPTAAFCAAMIAAVSTPVVYWSFSGMESTLVSFTGLCLILTTADYLVARPSGSLLKATMAISAFVLVRPEAPLLAGCVLTAALVAAIVSARFSESREKTTAVHKVLHLLLLWAVVCAALFAFRLTYFGALFPQPVAAKFEGVSVRTMLIGLHYLKGHAWNDGLPTAAVTLSIALGVAVIGLIQLRLKGLNMHVVVALLFAGGYLSFVVLAGGDWMEGGRFLAHFLPVAIGCVPMAVIAVTASRRMLLAVTAVLLALEAQWAVTFTRHSSTSIPLWAGVATETQDIGRRYSWFERHSRINIRDMPLIDRLDEVITRLSDRHTPVHIVSGQMGMVAYHIARRHFRRVRFLDRHGLIERSLTDCSVSRDLPKDTGGLVISFSRYFDNFPALAQSCGHQRPDVVFDIGTLAKSRVGAYGYEDVYSQTGDLAVIGSHFTGLRVLGDAFIAVDRDLLTSVGSLQPTSADRRR